MAITRVIATMKYFTATPEDASSNTFYFASVAEPDNTDAAAIATRLDSFYSAIDAYLSPIIQATTMDYRFYRMADPLPRTPFITLPAASLTLGAAGAPEEVSLCLSYAAVPASGQPANRRRGRIYVGPIADAAITNGSVSGFSQPLAAFRTALAGAAAVLADQSEPFQWAVYSPTDLVARQIVSGWVDNSFDTQRRRGRRATARTTWTGQP